MRQRLSLFCALALSSAHPLLCQTVQSSPALLDQCHGQSQTLSIFSGVPFLPVSVGGQKGYFLLDWATTRSVIDIITFPTPPTPEFRGGKAYFKQFNYFGYDIPEAQLSMQYLTYVALKDDAGTPVIESGILGTDQLDFAFTLDFRAIPYQIRRQFQGSVCPDLILKREGFASLSTAGFYAFTFESPNLATDDVDEPLPVLTVPLRIGGAWAPAQLDTGFGAAEKHSINFNRAYLQEMRAHGVRIHPKIEKSLATNLYGRVIATFSTCVPDVSETTTEYVLDDDTPAELMGTDGMPVLSVHNLHLYLKESPPKAKSCGGIGTWEKPGAQLDATFATENDAILIDAYSSRLWIRPKNATVAP